MKKTIRYIIPLFILSFVFASCDDNDSVKHETTISEFTYITEDMNLELKNTSKESYTLSWNPSYSGDNTTVFYEVQFAGEDANFEDLVYNEIPEKTGSINHLTLTDSTLNIIAEKAGIKQLTKGNLYWRVRASNGINEFIPEARKIEISRPAGFAAYPVNLYVKGSAVEGDGALKMLKNIEKGNTSADAIPNSSIFDLVVSLKKGELYFANSLTGRIRTFAVEGGKVAEDVDPIQIPADGIYRVRFNFGTLAAEVTSIQGVDQIIVKKDNENLLFKSLEYKGNSLWEASYTALLPDGSNIPTGTQYKFRVSETSLLSGTTSYSYWGAPAISASPPNSSTEAVYFYVTKVDDQAISATQLNYYRFANGVSGKSMKTSLNLNSDQVNYTHTCAIVE